MCVSVCLSSEHLYVQLFLQCIALSSFIHSPNPPTHPLTPCSFTILPIRLTIIFTIVVWKGTLYTCDTQIITVEEFHDHICTKCEWHATTTIAPASTSLDGWHSKPVSGKLVNHMMCLICSVLCRPGHGLPWQQNNLSITAAISRELKHSVNVLHSLVPYLQLLSSKSPWGLSVEAHS